MLNMKPYVPSTRVAVRESFDEDLSDDIEDDVFIRDGKSIKVRNFWILIKTMNAYDTVSVLLCSRHMKKKGLNDR